MNMVSFLKPWLFGLAVLLSGLAAASPATSAVSAQDSDPPVISVDHPNDGGGADGESGRTAEILPESIVFPGGSFADSWEVEVTNVEIQATIEDTILDETSIADGLYWIVLLDVTNVSDIPATFTDSLLYAHDQNGDIYNYHWRASDYRFGDEALYDQIPSPSPRNGWQPGETYHYAVAFDVPEGVEAITVQSEDATFAVRLGDTAPDPRSAEREGEGAYISGTLVLRQTFAGEYLDPCWGVSDSNTDIDLRGIEDGTTVSVYDDDGREVGSDELNDSMLMSADPLELGDWCHLFFTVKVPKLDAYTLEIEGLTPVTVDRKMLEMTDWRVEIGAG